MNEHLKPVFQFVLTAIEVAGIPYWVYGGVATAAIAGRFIRPSPDVDIFVLNDDYERTIEVVGRLEEGLNWKRKRSAGLLREKRPKQEWCIPNHEKDDIFSLIPVYKVGNKIQFVYTPRDLIPDSALTQERRTINGFSFVTPSVEFIRELFIHKLRSGRLSKERIEKCRKDAEVLFPEYTWQELLDKFVK